MKKVFLISIFSLVLFGCAGGLQLGSYQYSPLENRISYNGKNFNATIYKDSDSTTQTLHVVGIVTPKHDGSKIPDIKGSLSDTIDGGKRLDIFIKSKN